MTRSLYDAHRGKIDGVLLAHEQAEVLQTEDVATIKATVWHDVAAAGTKFCEFLDGQIQAKIVSHREETSE